MSRFTLSRRWTLAAVVTAVVPGACSSQHHRNGDGADSNGGADSSLTDAAIDEATDHAADDALDALKEPDLNVGDSPDVLDVGPPDLPGPDLVQPGVPFLCVENWPTASRMAPQPSLGGVPKVLWQKTIPGDTPRNSMVVTKDRVVLSVDRRVHILDRDGNAIAEVRSEAGEDLTAAVADAAQNLYFADVHYFYSVDMNGVQRWRSAFGARLNPNFEFSLPGTPIMNADGEVFVLGDDGYLTGLKAADGQNVFTAQVRTVPSLVPDYLAFGVSNTFFISQITTGTTSWAFKALRRDGVWAGDLESGPGRSMADAIPGYDIGLVGSRYVNTTTETTETTVFDRCGKAKWTVPGLYALTAAISFRDDLLVRDTYPAAAGSPRYMELRKFSKDGVLLAGPTRLPKLSRQLIAAADDTFVVVTCVDACGVGVTVMTYDSTLKEKWSLDIPGTCPESALLASNGVLYTVSRVMFEPGVAPRVEVMAIQTTSPGPAAAAWPQPRRDNNGSGWLTPP